MPHALVAVNNAAGNKLDYYLDRRVSYAGRRARSAVMRSTEVDLTLTNSVDGRCRAARLRGRACWATQADARDSRNDNRVTAGFWLPPAPR